MPMQELGFPVGASAIKALINNVDYPLLLGTDTFTRTGIDGAEPVAPLSRGDEFVGTLEGQWKKGWDANMDADQAFTAIIVGGVLEFEGEADVAGTAGNGWINGHHIIPLLDDVELNFTMQVPVDDTGGVADRDIQFDFFLRKEKAVDIPTADSDYLQWSINVDESGLLISIFREIAGASTTLFTGSTYDDTSSRDTGDLEGLVWRVVIHDGIAGAVSPQDVRHMHVYLKQKDTIVDAESETENELSTSPYDISGLTFKSAYPAYRIESENATYFDSGNEAKSTYLRVDYPLFHLAYDIADSDRGKGDVELWDTKGSATESDWQRVRDEDHGFGIATDVVLQNGLIRLTVDQGITSGLKLYYWNGAAWVQPLNRIRFHVNVDSEALIFPYVRSIVSVSPEKTVLEVRLLDSAVLNEDFYIDVQITLERGKYYVKFSPTEVYPLQDYRVWFLDDTTLRFGYAGDDEIGDDDLGVDGQNSTLTDNFLVAFDDEGTAVLGVLFTDEKPTAFFDANDGGDLIISSVDSSEATSTDIYFCLIPFALVANLFEEAEDGSFGAAGTVTDASASPLAGGNNAVQLNAIGDFRTPAGEYSAYTFTAGTHLPEGRYLALIRARYVVEEAMIMYVWNDDDDEFRNEENAKVSKTLGATFGYHSVVFDITAADVTGTNAFAIVAEKSDADADEIRIDYMLVIPLSDGEDLPQDLSHAAMREFTKPRRIIER